MSPRARSRTGLPFGQNYLWFEEKSLGLDAGTWALTAVTGQLEQSPDELNALDSIDEQPPAIPADVNADGVVDVQDLVAVIVTWGALPAPCPEDINGDGVVDVADLIEVILNWG